MSQPSNPWDDFFHVYVEFATAVRGESNDQQQVAKLDELLTHIKNGNSQDELHKAIVHDVIEKFKGKSQQIIWQDPQYFNEPLQLFYHVDIDIAELWHRHPLYRGGIWGWVEQIYIIGNVCLHPNRKDRFLQAVKELKRSKPGNEQDEGLIDGDEIEDNLDGVINGITQMFGMGDNPAMKEMMSEVAQQMHNTMKNTNNPMALIQSMLSGDTSCLGDLEQRMQAKMQQKIQNGEITTEELERQQATLMNQFGGLQGIGRMAQQMGVQLPENFNATTAAAAAAATPPVTQPTAPKTASGKNKSSSNPNKKKKQSKK
jgi:hypothetical protein